MQKSRMFLTTLGLGFVLNITSCAGTNPPTGTNPNKGTVGQSAIIDTSTLKVNRPEQQLQATTYSEQATQQQTQTNAQAVTKQTKQTTAEEPQLIVHYDSPEGVMLDWDMVVPPEAKIVKIELDNNINASVISDWSKVLFIGDSLTSGIYKVRNNTEIEASNFMFQGGIGVNQIQTLFLNKPNGLDSYPNLQKVYSPSDLNTLQRQLNADITDVIIGLGTNDLNTEQQNFKNKYTQALNQIKQISPGIKIHIWNIKPCKSGTGSKSVNIQNIDNLNNKIKEMCEENNYHYIDTYMDIKDNLGWVSDDGIHMTSEGYKSLISIIVNSCR